MKFCFSKTILSNNLPNPKLLLISDAIQCHENIPGNPFVIWLIFVGSKFFKITNLFHKYYLRFRFVSICDNLDQRVQSKSPLFVEFYTQPTEHLIDLIMRVAN